MRHPGECTWCTECVPYGRECQAQADSAVGDVEISHIPMTDLFRIDSHKLIFHPGRVAQFLAAGEWKKGTLPFNPGVAELYTATNLALIFISDSSPG